MEAKDEKQLGFDRDGLYTGFKPDDENTHYDVMHVKYRQCAKCKKWYPESGYALKADGTPKMCCNNCLENLKEAHKAKKASAKTEPPAKVDLSQVPPQDLIQEMRRRGWKGNITVTMDFEL